MTDLHTILRLPTGIFYAQGAKANVIFFDNRPAAKEPQTREVWYYDYRTNVHHTLKRKPLRHEDLAEFVQCYNPANRHERRQTWSEETPDGRWRRYGREELLARDKASLDLFCLKDKSLTDLDNMPEPEDPAEEIIENLEVGWRACGLCWRRCGHRRKAVPCGAARRAGAALRPATRSRPRRSSLPSPS